MVFTFKKSVIRAFMYAGKQKKERLFFWLAVEVGLVYFVYPKPLLFIFA